ncbi:mitochondrial triosephosphate isomerase [Copromyces sp. CBS 386.78]|nr:mitochondrial triosephosphate isomerase [Copromyces sp. CBS 386.78]
MPLSLPSNPFPRRRVVGVSTKMYFSHARTVNFLKSFFELMDGHTLANRALAADLAARVDIFIIPDHLSLRYAINDIEFYQCDYDPITDARVFVGAQNCYWEDSGAFTGEVSPAVLAEVGCRVVELGHAERRRYFGETDEMTSRKAQAVVRNGMVPLICVGEGSPGEVPPPGEGAIKKAAEEVVGQVERCLDGIDPIEQVLLAYEPVWAIGAAQPAGTEHVRAVVRAIRQSKVVREREEKGGETRILYGGSAGPGLFERLKEEDGVDGLFLGRFAHEEEQFWKTICEVAEVKFEEESKK